MSGMHEHDDCRRVWAKGGGETWRPIEDPGLVSRSCSRWRWARSQWRPLQTRNGLRTPIQDFSRCRRPDCSRPRFSAAASSAINTASCKRACRPSKASRLTSVFSARATGYQLWIGKGFESPLAPGSGSFPRLNFGRFQGGADFTLLPGRISTSQAAMTWRTATPP